MAHSGYSPQSPLSTHRILVFWSVRACVPGHCFPLHTQVPAHIRFLSVEPLLGRIEHLPLDGIHWVIVGGESGPGARPMEIAWVEGIYHQCRAAGVPFFFKQWGGVHKSRAGREFLGQTFDEMPIGALRTAG